MVYERFQPMFRAKSLSEKYRCGVIASPEGAKQSPHIRKGRLLRAQSALAMTRTGVLCATTQERETTGNCYPKKGCKQKM